MPEVYLSETSKNEPLVLMQISCGNFNDDICSLYIGEHDDAKILAKLFVQTLRLDESNIPRVELQINERRKQAMDSRVETSSPIINDHLEQCSISPVMNDNLEQCSVSPVLSPAEAAYQAAQSNWHNNSPIHAQIPTSYRDMKYSSGPKSAKKLPNQEAFDRMHNYSKHKAQRAEQLRNRMENERVRQIESSTFKYVIFAFSSAPCCV